MPSLFDIINQRIDTACRNIKVDSNIVNLHIAQHPLAKSEITIFKNHS